MTFASMATPSEIVFQGQSYSNLQSGRSLAWDHFRGDVDDPCAVIADPCGVIADLYSIISIIVNPGSLWRYRDPCSVVAIPEAIGGRRCQPLHDSLNILKHH